MKNLRLICRYFKTTRVIFVSNFNSIINPADLRFMRNGTQKSYAQQRWKRHHCEKKAETHLRSCQTFTIVIFSKIFNSYVPLTIFSKKARATDFSQGPKFSSEKLIIEQTVLFLFQMHHMNMEDTEYVSVFLANIYLFKVSNSVSRKRCSNLTIKTSE